MGVSYSVTKHALRTTDGLQSYPLDLGGDTPKIVLLRLVRCATEDAPTADAYYGRGGTDGVTSFTLDFSHRDNVATSESRSAIAAGAAASVDCMRLRRIANPADLSNSDCRLRFSSFGADELVLDVTNAPPSGYLLEVVALGGSSLTATVDAFTTGISAGSFLDRTGLGVPADAAVVFHTRRTAGAVSTSASMVEGYWSAAAHSAMAAVGGDFDDNQNPSTAEQTIRDDCNGVAMLGTGFGRVTLSQIAAGYRMTAVEVAGSQIKVVVALSFGGAAVAWAGLLSTSTSLGASSWSTPRIRPGLVLASYSRRRTKNDGDDVSSVDSCVCGGGAWTPSEEASGVASARAGVSPTVTRMHSGSRFLSIPQEDGSLAGDPSTPQDGDAILATATQAPQGLAFTYARASSASRYVAVLLIGAEFVLVPDAALAPLVVPSPQLFVGSLKLPSPAAIACNVPAVNVILPRSPSPAAIALLVDEVLVDAPPVVPLPSELPPLAPLYRETLAALAPRGLAFPRRPLA